MDLFLPLLSAIYTFYAQNGLTLAQPSEIQINILERVVNEGKHKFY